MNTIIQTMKNTNSTQKSIILKLNSKGFTVKEISEGFNKSYRYVFGTIWRDKNNYKQPKSDRFECITSDHNFPISVD